MPLQQVEHLHGYTDTRFGLAGRQAMRAGMPRRWDGQHVKRTEAELCSKLWPYSKICSRFLQAAMLAERAGSGAGVGNHSLRPPPPLLVLLLSVLSSSSSSSFFYAYGESTGARTAYFVLLLAWRETPVQRIDHRRAAVRRVTNVGQLRASSS